MVGLQPLPDEVKMGLQCLIQGEFYEAHEFFEVAWRHTPDDSREFYRALIQFSGGFFRLQQGRSIAAKKFFSSAHTWINLFPSEYMDFDIVAIAHFIEELLDKINLGMPSGQILEETHPILQSLFRLDPR